MTASSDCPFCAEESLAERRYVASAADAEKGRPRLLHRTLATDVLVGLGAMTAGYVLVIPRRHVLSCGGLPDAERVEVFDIAWEFAERIRRTFTCQVVVVEHGSSGSSSAPSGACIAHAHLHLFPVPSNDAVAAFVVDPSRAICGTRELAEVATAGRNYYYCARDRQAGYLCESPRIGSQHARRVWARLLGRADQWDWALFPEEDVCDETAKLLSPEAQFSQRALAAAREPLPPGEAMMAATLQAYADGANAYAGRTHDFQHGSNLPEELRDFAAAHDGLLLDAGAGAGRDAALLASLGRRVIAFDASRGLLAHVPEGPNLTRLQGDLRRLPLRDASIGGIWCSGVLLHMGRADLVTCLMEFARVLEPEGLTQVSLKEGSGHVAESMPSGRGLLRHFFYYRADDVIPLVERAGLTVDCLWTVTGWDSSKVERRWLKLRLVKARS